MSGSHRLCSSFGMMCNKIYPDEINKQNTASLQVTYKGWADTIGNKRQISWAGN